jgi:carbon monoxide dehydrogenase subunit G
MELEQQFTVGHPPARVWAFFADVPAVAACLPGAEILDIDDEGRIKGRMNVRFGPISAGFAGEGSLSRDDASLSGTLAGSGLDQKSRSQCKGEVAYRLAETEDGGTRIDLSVDYTLTGTLAQFSRGGLVNDLAARLTADFAQALEAALATGPAAEAEVAAEAPAPSAPQALDASGLLGAVLWERIKRFFARLFGKE